MGGVYLLFYFFIVKTKYSTAAVRIYPTFCCCCCGGGGGGVVYNFSFLDWLAESKEMERVDERDVTSVHLPLFTRLRRAVFFLHTMHTRTHSVWVCDTTFFGLSRDIHLVLLLPHWCRAGTRYSSRLSDCCLIREGREGGIQTNERTNCGWVPLFYYYYSTDRWQEAPAHDNNKLIWAILLFFFSFKV